MFNEGDSVRLKSHIKISYPPTMWKPMLYAGAARRNVKGQDDIDDVLCTDGNIRCVTLTDIEADV